MAGSNIFTGWMNSSKIGVAVSSTSSSYTNPSPKTTQDITILSLKVPAPSWAKVAFSFSRPIAGSPSITASSNYIYAYSSSPPSQIDNIRSSFSQHTSTGSLSGIDFTTAGNGSAGTSTTSGKPILAIGSVKYTTIILIHGIVMFGAWGVLPFIGIYFAKFMKHIGHNWYRVHMYPHLTQGLNDADSRRNNRIIHSCRALQNPASFRGPASDFRADYHARCVSAGYSRVCD
jgi:hypothetical protein